MKKRVLYKECKISGTDTHDLSIIWNKIKVGDPLVMFSTEGDNKEVMVALSDGQGDEFVDMDLILGCVPSSVGEFVSTMMAMGWKNAFECEVSRIEGDNPYYGALYMNIYIVSNADAEEEIELDSNLRAAYFGSNVNYEYFLKSLFDDGQVEYRWGGYDGVNVDEIDEGEECVFIYRTENRSYLYLMHCVDVDEYESDDVIVYTFTNVKGPVVVPTARLEFLESENLGDVEEIMEFLPESAAEELLPLILDEQELEIYNS